MPEFNAVSHVIFDMDGLLLDTEPVYERVIACIAESYGKKYTPEIRIKILGTTEMNTCRIAVTEMGLPITPEEFKDKFKAATKEAFGDIPMMKGAERLIRHLHEHNILFSLATSSSIEALTRKIQKHLAVFDLFSHKVSGSSDPAVKNGKPAPDIFLIAAERFPDAPAPEKCLVFEDAPNGVRGATLAGMQTVMVPDDLVNDELRKEATVVLKSLEDFQPEQFGLPPFKDAPNAK